MITTDFKQWKENIFSAIKDLSDKSFQQEAWLGHSKNYVSSFDEDISMLYDSYCFDDEFWKEENLSRFHFSNELLFELRKLKTMIDSYERKATDIEILEDPKWDEIVNEAKKIIEIWNG